MRVYLSIEEVLNPVADDAFVRRQRRRWTHTKRRCLGQKSQLERQSLPQGTIRVASKHTSGNGGTEDFSPQCSEGHSCDTSIYRTVEQLSVEAGAPIYSARTPANNTSSSPVPHSTFCRFPSSRGLRRDQGRGGTWLVMEVRTTEVKEASCKCNVIITSKGNLEPGRKAGVDQPFPTISCYGKNQGE